MLFLKSLCFNQLKNKTSPLAKDGDEREPYPDTYYEVCGEIDGFDFIETRVNTYHGKKGENGELYLHYSHGKSGGGMRVTRQERIGKLEKGRQSYGTQCYWFQYLVEKEEEIEAAQAVVKQAMIDTLHQMKEKMERAITQWEQEGFQILYPLSQDEEQEED